VGDFIPFSFGGIQVSKIQILDMIISISLTVGDFLHIFIFSEPLSVVFL
jgi:hypothetical protein